MKIHPEIQEALKQKRVAVIPGGSALGMAVLGLMASIEPQAKQAPKSEAADGEDVCPCFFCELRRTSDEFVGEPDETTTVVSESAACDLGATPNTMTPTQAAAGALLTSIDASMLSGSEKAIYKSDVLRAAKALHAIETGA